MLRVSGIRRINASVMQKCKQKLRVTQQLTATSNRQRQHLSCIVSMVTDASIEHVYYDDYLLAREIQRNRRSLSVSSIRCRYRYRYCIRYFGTEISFGIPSYGIFIFEQVFFVFR